MLKIEPGIVREVSSTKLDMTTIPMDDERSLKNLNELDVFGVFQFETKVAMGVIKTIGIDSFEDMYAATTLGRPDPLSGDLHTTYGMRKRGEEYWESIPVMADILDQSMGLPLYQESVMLISRRLAGFSGAEANALRKGLAKGKDNEDTMKKLQKMLADLKVRSQDSVKNGDVSQEQLDELIATLEKFGGYGFNKCISPDTIVELKDGMKMISELELGDEIKAPNDDFSGDEFVKVVDTIDSGEKELFEITLESGLSIKATQDHKFLCEDNQIRPLSEIISEDLKIICNSSLVKAQKIVKIKSLGKMPTMDISVENNHHLFYANGGIITSNSHAVSYAMVAYWSLFLKTYYPVQFMVALLNFTDLARKDDKGTVVLKKYIQHAKKMGVKIAPPNINVSQNSFSLDGETIRWGLSMLKGLGAAGAKEVLSKRPYDSFEDFLGKVEKRKVNKSKVGALIKCGAFDEFGDREFLINYYLGEIRKEKGYEFVPFGDEQKRDAEEEILGTAISFSVIPDEVYAKISDYGIKKIGSLEDTMEGSFLGSITSVKKTNSKKSGKEMMIVGFADDFDDTSFFVWESNIEEIEKKLIIGHIMVMPLKKFDLDGDGCFFNGKVDDVIDLSDED